MTPFRLIHVLRLHPSDNKNISSERFLFACFALLLRTAGATPHPYGRKSGLNTGFTASLRSTMVRSGDDQVPGTQVPAARAAVRQGGRRAGRLSPYSFGWFGFCCPIQAHIIRDCLLTSMRCRVKGIPGSPSETVGYQFAPQRYRETVEVLYPANRLVAAALYQRIVPVYPRLASNTCPCPSKLARRPTSSPLRQDRCSTHCTRIPPSPRRLQCLVQAESPAASSGTMSGFRVLRC